LSKTGKGTQEEDQKGQQTQRTTELWMSHYVFPPRRGASKAK
jgi:hypothetical protein